MWRTRRIAREALRVASRRSSGPRTLVDRAEHLAAAAASVPRASTGGIWSLRRGGRHVCREEGSLGPSRVSHRAFSDSSAGDPRGACWSCGGGTSRSDLFFCGGCGAVLPALDDEDDDASDQPRRRAETLRRTPSLNLNLKNLLPFLLTFHSFHPKNPLFRKPI